MMLQRVQSILSKITNSEGRDYLRFRLKCRIADLRCSLSPNRHRFEYRRRDGVRFLYHRSVPFSGALYAYEDFEIQEINFVCHWLKDGGTFVDGGANLGIFTASVLQKCNQVRVIAVECNPVVAELMHLTMKELHLNSFELIQNALGRDSSGWVINDSSNPDYALNQPRACQKEVPGAVQTTSLSELLKGKIDYPLVIKLDLEGHEYAALEGLQSFLDHGNEPPVLMMEWSGTRLKELGVSETSIWNWFQRNHYEIRFGGGFGRGEPFGSPINQDSSLPETFNMIGIPQNESSMNHWKKLFSGGLLT